jgi:MoaA/NifB/PqqE/SkfB family radical SAM enzyme
LLDIKLKLHPTLLSQKLPDTISLETTNHCNLRCSHCGHSQYEKFSKGNLDQKYFEQIKPFLGDSKVKTLSLSDFGELFLSSKCDAMFAAANAIEGIKLNFITNGLLIHKHWDIFKIKGLSFNVSFDGASEQTYAHFRGKGYFDKVVSNLEMLYEKEINGEVEKSERGFIVVLSTVNVHEMPDIIKLAARLGFSNVCFTFQVFFDEQQFKQESLLFSQQEYDNYLDLAIVEAKENNIDILHLGSFDGKHKMPALIKNSWVYKDEQNKLRCSFVNNHCSIQYHGQVEVCDAPDRYIVGSLNENEFLDVWHGSYYRNLRLSFAREELTVNCENCNVMQSVDIFGKQSHFMHLVRDKGEHVSMPQPYLITQLDKQYQEAISSLENKDSFDISMMDQLVKLSRLDNNFYEIMNALGVCWNYLGDPEKAKQFFLKALRINPDDLIAKDNLNKLNQIG